ncbi:MAG: prenyltransferase, partial [Acidobacteria bacterium]|nr:prenyltransferase [Acidobacteriota bacterium]NIQ30692.1 prenyltransferase [Acidobacteriota bacterium]NIQ85651.1 prenyltransferase [Acidobacteriota bacterium]
LVASGAAAAAWAGQFNWLHTAVGLFGLVALHIAANVFNEWSDMARTGIDLHTQRTPFSGGTGTLPSGAISTRSALLYGIGWAIVGLAIGIWFITRIGWALLPIMIAGAIMVVFYTDVLAKFGVGEIAAGLGLGALPVIGIALVQAGNVPDPALAAAVPAFFMTFNLLLLNEFPDVEADRQGGRRHLIILFGRPAAAKIYAIAAILTPVAIVIAVVMGYLPLFALAATLPSLILLVKPLQWAFGNPEQPVPLPAMGANVIWNLSTNTLLAIALIVATL